MRIEFHPEALGEFEEAIRYYSRIQSGLEQRFISCVESALFQIEESPERWNIYDPGIRRFLVNVFPYAILYSIENDYVLILAIMHCRQRPGYWRKRT